jgi:hypothetical protein
VAAVIFILDDLHRMMWPAVGLIESALEGSWAGAEYLAMQEERLAAASTKGERS